MTYSGVYNDAMGLANSIKIKSNGSTYHEKVPRYINKWVIKYLYTLTYEYSPITNVSYEEQKMIESLLNMNLTLINSSFMAWFILLIKRNCNFCTVHYTLTTVSGSILLDI